MSLNTVVLIVSAQVSLPLPSVTNCVLIVLSLRKRTLGGIGENIQLASPSPVVGASSVVPKGTQRVNSGTK